MKSSFSYWIIYDALWILHVELQTDILRAKMSILLLLSINYVDRFLKKKYNVKWVWNIIICKENVTLNKFMLKTQSVVVCVSYLILKKKTMIL